MKERETKLTAEQRAAIGEEGRVIVSASAGSGKTHVMIERLVRIILSRKATVREILAVTFTNKAAAQMRDRLRRALLERVAVAEGEEREYLKAQIADLPLAEISTIHAFCGRLVRTRFYLAGVDPAFRVIAPEDAEGSALSARALDETFENAYEEGGEDFYRLLSVYYHKKKDTELRKLVRDLTNSARALADYRDVLSRMGEDRFGEVCAYLAEDYRRRAEKLRARAADLLAYFKEIGHAGVKLGTQLAEAVDALLAEDTLFGLAARAAETCEISSAPASTKETGELLLRLLDLKDLSAAVKSFRKELAAFCDEETEYARYLDANARAKALASLALRYDEAYSALKRDAGVLDYDDLEHFALAILSSPEVAAEVRGEFRYVFVDEYQDVNPAQEKLLSLLAGEEVFLVGDGKQAIYGFRGSRSEYFYNKTEEYRPKSLRLTQNFRSASAVLEAVNRVFSPLVGEDGVMTGGSLYGDYRGKADFIFCEKKKEEPKKRGVYSVLTGGGQETDERTETVVRLIESEIGQPVMEPGGEVRPAGYGDIAVLARKNRGDAENIVRALAARDIPVTTTAKVNAFGSFEGKLLLDWLSFLDNAEQDIPLVSAMLSAIGGFTEDDLAAIRLRVPFGTFRAACAEYAAKEKDALSERLLAFRARVENYRLLAAVRSATEIIGLLLADGLEAQIAAKRGGAGRLARVRRISAESEGAGSVHAFLAKLRTRGYEVDFAESGGEDAVKVLTMHAAKGLEYPIVIVAGMDTSFHPPEMGELAWTDRFFAAPHAFDLQKKTYYETVLRRASKIEQVRSRAKDERNLFYVAMTRARCRLHLVFDECAHTYDPVCAKRFSDFVDLAALTDLRAEAPAVSAGGAPRAAFTFAPDAALIKEISDLLAWEYPYADSTKLPVKSSATAILREEETPVSVFAGRGGNIEEGLAYHAFLQKVRFGGSAEEELARMRREGLLTGEELALLDSARLTRILALPCFSALEGKRVLREQNFLVSLPAREIYGTDAEDEIVFQGAIDLIAEGKDGYEIYDYKDSGRDDEALRLHYRPQIALYRKALARALKVDERTVRARIVNIRLCREIPM